MMENESPVDELRQLVVCALVAVALGCWETYADIKERIQLLENHREIKED